MTKGVYYSAYGPEAVKECLASIRTLRNNNQGLAVCVITDDCKPFRHAADTVTRFESDPFGRLAKLSAPLLSPFDLTLYLDADTRVYGALDLPFRALEDGWEFVATLSENQGDKWLMHIEETEREAALDEIGYPSSQIQGGVWGFRQCLNTTLLFKSWRELYAHAGEREQGALQVALHRQPIKTYILGRHWNGGAIVGHRYGQARRKG